MNGRYTEQRAFFIAFYLVPSFDLIILFTLFNAWANLLEKFTSFAKYMQTVNQNNSLSNLVLSSINDELANKVNIFSKSPQLFNFFVSTHFWIFIQIRIYRITIKMN